ncbi:type VI secretion system baseplate subunit TssG [Bordetella genomosp. 10]|nr:type VI secretion system baseplate subunit TssG [Bordetella genomosp. 10]
MDTPSDPIPQNAAPRAGMDAAAPLPPAFWRDLARDPYSHDLYHVLRWIDARGGARLPLGRETVPRHEPVRMRQEPSMAFAPSTLAAARPARADRPPELSIYSFGLFGPNGPLPLHMTEHVRERIHHYGDATLAAFADLFHHRLILLFYRAWADAQSTVSLDRRDDRFSRYVACLLHMGQPSMRGRDKVVDHAKYHMASHLLRQTRNPEGLQQILRHYFGVPVRIREFVPQWIRLAPDQRLGLRGSQGLGRDTILGAAVRDAQHKFRIEIGPLAREQYDSFLPGARSAEKLVQWVRHYTGIEFAWDVRLVLAREHVSGARLGDAPIGLRSWLGHRPAALGDAGDLVIDYETRRARAAGQAQPSFSYLS